MESTERADIHDPVVAETDEDIHKHDWEAACMVCMHVNLHVTDWMAAQ